MAFATIAVVVIALILLGVALLTTGLIGRRTGSHPHCRKCRFNLHNLPPTSARCPECGADLSLPRSTQTGLRHRRPALYVPGLAILILLTALSIPILRGQLTPATLLRHTPTPALAYLLRTSTGSLSAPVAREALNRLKLPTKNPTAEQALLTALLARQPNLKVNWLHEHDDIAKFAHDAGQLSQDQWHRYLNTGLETATATITMPTRWRAGVAPTASLVLSNVRLHHLTALSIKHRFGSSDEPLLSSARGLQLLGPYPGHITHLDDRQLTPTDRHGTLGHLHALTALPPGPLNLAHELSLEISAPSARPSSSKELPALQTKVIRLHQAVELLNGPARSYVHAQPSPAAHHLNVTISDSAVRFGNDPWIFRNAVSISSSPAPGQSASVIGNYRIHDHTLIFSGATSISPTSSNSPDDFAPGIPIPTASRFDFTQTAHTPVNSIILRSNPRLAETLLPSKPRDLTTLVGIWHLPNITQVTSSTSVHGTPQHTLPPLVPIDTSSLAALSLADLLNQLNSADPLTRDNAVWELLRRTFDSPPSLSPELSSIIEQLLTLQGDESIPWNHQIGDLLEQLHEAGLLTQAQFSRYLRQILPPSHQFLLSATAQDQRMDLRFKLPSWRAATVSHTGVDQELYSAWLNTNPSNPSRIDKFTNGPLPPGPMASLFTFNQGVHQVTIAPTHHQSDPTKPRLMHLRSTIYPLSAWIERQAHQAKTGHHNPVRAVSPANQWLNETPDPRAIEFIHPMPLELPQTPTPPPIP
jgi:hypothetical protein